MDRPLPIDYIEELSVHEGAWRKSETHVCNSCGKPAYYHPHTDEIWGCRNCGFSAYADMGYFKSVSAETDHQKYQPNQIHTDEEFGQIK